MASEVAIIWSKSYSFLQEGIIQAENEIDDGDFYKICAVRNLNGGKSIMRIGYIGQSYHGNSTCFTRLKTHLKDKDKQDNFMGRFFFPDKLLFNIGTLNLLNRERISKALVDDVENLLVLSSPFAINRSGNKRFCSSKSIIIHNEGSYNPLDQDISTREKSSYVYETKLAQAGRFLESF